MFFCCSFIAHGYANKFLCTLSSSKYLHFPTLSGTKTLCLLREKEELEKEKENESMKEKNESIEKKNRPPEKDDKLLPSMPLKKKKRGVKQKSKPSKDEATAYKETKNRKLVNISFLMCICVCPMVHTYLLPLLKQYIRMIFSKNICK